MSNIANTRFKFESKCKNVKKQCYNPKTKTCFSRKGKKFKYFCVINPKLCPKNTFPCVKRINSLQLCVKPASFVLKTPLPQKYINPTIKSTPIPPNFVKILSLKSKKKIENMNSYRIVYTGKGSSEKDKPLWLKGTGSGPYYSPHKFCQILTSNFPKITENCENLNLSKLQKLLDYSGGLRYTMENYQYVKKMLSNKKIRDKIKIRQKQKVI